MVRQEIQDCKKEQKNRLNEGKPIIKQSLASKGASHKRMGNQDFFFFFFFSGLALAVRFYFLFFFIFSWVGLFGFFYYYYYYFFNISFSELGTKKKTVPTDKCGTYE